MAWRYSSHALGEMERRGISRDKVDTVLAAPQQTLTERDGILALQSVLDFPGEGSFLVRVLVNQEQPATVVTVYRTSKISKYWRQT